MAGFSGGVYVDVNLVDASLPAHAGVDLRLLAGGDVEVTADTRATLALKTLEGDIGGYVESPRVCIPYLGCAGGRYSKTFKSWSAAVEKSWDLFDFDWQAPLSLWRSACDRAEVACEG
ncbi:MAG: hypothetical protein R3F60_04250 [bacterium]